MTMGLRIPVVVATVAAHDWFGPCIASLAAQNPVQAEVLVIQQSRATEIQVDASRASISEVWRPGFNVGTSMAWNWGLRRAWDKGHQVALVLNDDMILSDPRTLTVLRDIFVCCPRQLRYLHDRGFSAVVISRAVTEECGFFDEGYWPAYFEDNDYHRRTILAGIPWDEILIDTAHVGSGTLKADSDLSMLNAQVFGMNSDRYHAKWGGGPGYEQWTVPWNGGPARPGVREIVAPEVRAGIERLYQGVPA